MKFLVCFAIAIAFLAISSAKSIEKEDADKSIGDEICEMCQLLVGEATTQILEHEEDFRKNGGKICDVVTFGNNNLDAKCHEILKDKVDQIISMVKSADSPKDVCIAIKVCSE